MNQGHGAHAPEFRQQMVELVKAGRKIRELARKFGCHETSISAWVRQAQADEIGGGRPDAPLTTAERQELMCCAGNCVKSSWSATSWQRLQPGLPTRIASTRRLRADRSKPGLSAGATDVPIPERIHQRETQARADRSPSRQALANQIMTERIWAIHKHSDATYGMPRIHAELRASGEVIGKNRVARLIEYI